MKLKEYLKADNNLAVIVLMLMWFIFTILSFVFIVKTDLQSEMSSIVLASIMLGFLSVFAILIAILFLSPIFIPLIESFMYLMKIKNR